MALRIADHPRCTYDDAQKEYLKSRLAYIMQKSASDSTLNLWNEEIDILKNTLDERQLKLLFSVKNAKPAARRVNNMWKILAEEGLTTTLDSAKEWNRAFQFTEDRLRISDIYRFKNNEKRLLLEELKVHRPILIRMFDAYNRKLMGMTDMRRETGDVKLEFGSVAAFDTLLGKAILALKGLDTEVRINDAINILQQRAINDSNVIAMNALAVAYITGTGVSIDTIQALNWFQLAIDKKLPLACHNLGMAYKYSIGGLRQDYSEACKYFKIGANMNSFTCHYDYGFMLYKGLGCLQSYEDAVSHFFVGAKKFHIHSLYMLGLCYRNGFGVERDEDKGNSYLRQAEILGNGAATEELEKETPENDIYRDVSNANTPLHMPEISTEFTDLSKLSGEYEGILVQYDWSGQYVLNEKPIALTLICDGKSADGTIKIDGETATFSSNTQSDGRLRFNSGEICLSERYSGKEGIVYKLEEATLDAWNDRIAGRLSLYSTLQKEPERPMYIELYRKSNVSKDVNGQSISISSNQFDSHLIIDFDMDEDVPSVDVRIFNRSGMLVERKTLNGLIKGHHTINFTPAIPNGLYVLNIKAENHMLRTLIVKKGGEE